MFDSEAVANAIECHLQRNLALRENLIQKGVELDAPRNVDLHFWSIDQLDAAMLARSLYQSGFLILILAPSEQDSGEIFWNVTAGIKEPILRIISPEFTERIVRLALAHSSEFDGWGTSV
jgi:hypothetical protein